ncbi:MAG: arginine--tRNA ligase, partial [Solirubrobacterales bacterium]|nr:arginine--tRNA ligase [Solirubrobacterales bacterium]
MNDALQELRSAVEQAAAGLGGETKAPPTLERPKHADHGDYATNAAMLLTKSLKRPPREIAADLSAALAERLGDGLDRVEIAGPGFLNLVLSDGWHADALAGVAEAAAGWGRSVASPPRNVNVEFVSANPTGP